MQSYDVGGLRGGWVGFGVPRSIETNQDTFHLGVACWRCKEVEVRKNGRELLREGFRDRYATSGGSTLKDPERLVSCQTDSRFFLKMRS